MKRTFASTLSFIIVLGSTPVPVATATEAPLEEDLTTLIAQIDSDLAKQQEYFKQLQEIYQQELLKDSMKKIPAMPKPMPKHGGTFKNVRPKPRHFQRTKKMNPYKRNPRYTPPKRVTPPLQPLRVRQSKLKNQQRLQMLLRNLKVSEEIQEKLQRERALLRAILTHPEYTTKKSRRLIKQRAEAQYFAERCKQKRLNDKECEANRAPSKLVRKSIGKRTFTITKTQKKTERKKPIARPRYITTPHSPRHAQRAAERQDRAHREALKKFKERHGPKKMIPQF
jgi:hypothetical protein